MFEGFIIAIFIITVLVGLAFIVTANMFPGMTEIGDPTPKRYRNVPIGQINHTKYYGKV